MCGIIGYTGKRGGEIRQILLESLRRLEYRGYDSAGIAVLEKSGLRCVKTQGKLGALEKKLEGQSISSGTGIGHTRWATHGEPNEPNSHPHFDASGKIALVHNGIFENYQDVKKKLLAQDHEFKSQTDSEVLAHWIGEHYKGDLTLAVAEALKTVQGNYAICAFHADHPNLIVGARSESPLIIGIGEGENFFASDVPAILPYTRRVIYLNDGEIAALRPDRVEILDADGGKLAPKIQDIHWSVEDAKKEGHPHFMLKEIFEQPKSMEHTLRGRIDETSGLVRFEDLDLKPDDLKKIRRAVILACGTAWHAGIIGKYAFEEYARIPTEAVTASEFRYGDPFVDDKTLVIAVTQSGETADTLAGLKMARQMGAKTLAVCNVIASSIPRECEGTVYMYCGPEIGVASTKAYTSMLASLFLLAFRMAEVRESHDRENLRRLLAEMKTLPSLIKKCLKLDPNIRELADTFKDCRNFMYIGRRYNFPNAYEAALKLKEISYIHAEGYSSGEMKHGPIALIEATFPTVAFAPQGKTYSKMISNIQEIKARGGVVLAIASEGDKGIWQVADHVLEIPASSEIFSTILSIIPMQLFAYHIAVAGGKDPDQPRNLAKSVTVE